MNKKLIKATLMLMLAAPLSATAGIQSELDQPTIEIVEPVVQVTVPTQEVSKPTVLPESEIARKMKQAEKARNAAENDGWGGAITIIAMCIVLSALIILSVLFLGFGKISEAILTHKKRQAKKAADHAPTDNHDLAPGEVIAAISLALAEHFAEGHDVEDTILTIRRMQKAYSPWNSKIYNLRNQQEHHRNPSLPYPKSNA